jgi:gag-polypeptide of LTR copia-type
MSKLPQIRISDIPKFDGTYFLVWKRRLSLLLRSEKLIGVVDGTTPMPITPPPSPGGTITHVLSNARDEWETKDALSLSLITNTLENNQISHIAKYEHAFEAWATLTELYGAQDIVTEMHLMDKLSSLKMTEGESVTKHVHNF